jgi:hypothetical protein
MKLNNVDLECMECRDTQISAWLQGVWQSHSRHADLRKVSSQKRPSTGDTWHPRRRPSFRRKILGVQSRLVELTKAHRPREVTFAERPTNRAMIIPRYCKT